MATRTPNLRGKTRLIDSPYAIYIDEAAGFEYRVLKAYSADDDKPYGRWFLATRSPYTWGEWKLGDGYIADVKRTATLVEVDGVPVINGWAR